MDRIEIIRQLRVRAQPPSNAHFTDAKATLLGAAADMLEVDEHIDAFRTVAAERIKELEARLAQLEAPQQAAVACAPCASCGQFMPAAAREIFKGYCHACTAGAAVLNQKALDNARRFANAREVDFEHEVDQRKKAEDAVEMLEKKLAQGGTAPPTGVTIAWESESNRVVVTYGDTPNSVRVVTRRS